VAEGEEEERAVEEGTGAISSRRSGRKGRKEEVSEDTTGQDTRWLHHK
jgi:hypothetical protein